MRTLRSIHATWALFFAVACGGDDSSGTDAGTDAATGDGAVDAAETCSTAADCDDGTFCNGREQCMPGSPDADARGCVPAPEPACLPSQSCDEGSDDCLSDCDTDADADGDGHDAIECGGDDCDDADPDRYPGNAEVCDEGTHDEDCDPSTYGARDADMDGAEDAACCNEDDGTLVCGSDCDDSSPSVNPAASEECNGADDDCDGTIPPNELDDDGDGYAECEGDCNDEDPSTHPGATEVCDGVDNDCVDGIPSTEEDDDSDGYAECEDDCNDSDATVHPGADEACDGLDTDCDGSIPGVETDDDGDGVAECEGDCDDADASVSPDASEVPGDPDDVDEDCDGDIACYHDNDEDGYGTPTVVDPAGVSSCGEVGFSYESTDCCDTDADAHPGASGWFYSEVGCGGWDYNCNGTVQYESRDTTWSCDGDPPGCTSVNEGWYDTSYPECGVTEQWVESCSATGGSVPICTAGAGDRVDRQQGCR